MNIPFKYREIGQLCYRGTSSLSRHAQLPGRVFFIARKTAQPVPFEQFVSLMRKGKDTRMFIPNGKHSPTEEELATAYVEIFKFLEGL